MELKEVIIKHRAAILSAAAVLAIVGVAGCPSQQKSNSTAARQGNSANAQAAIDNSAHQYSLYALDRQTFINPSTGQKIEASNQFNHQWMSSDGQTLIQTQDHALDPNGSVYPVSQSWTELVPTF